MHYNNTFRFCLFFLLSFTTFYGQTNKDGSITVNGKYYSGKISIDHQNKIITSMASGEENNFLFANVSSVTLEGEQYEVKETKNSGFVILSRTVSGKANLYRDIQEENIYLETEATGARRLSLGNLVRLRGELLLYFSDCTPVRNAVNNLSRITSHTISDLTRQYNQCNYSEGFVISAEELEASETEPRDLFSFYLGVGYYASSVSFNPGGDEKNFGNLALNAGVTFRPGLIRVIQDDLFFTVNLDYLLPRESIYATSASGRAEVNSSAIKSFGGIHYNFNNEGNWQPYIGVTGGMIFADYAIVYDENGIAAEDDIRIRSEISKMRMGLEPEIGVIYNISDKGALNLNLKYVPAKEINFNTSKTFSIPMSIEESGFLATLRYIFL